MKKASASLLLSALLAFSLAGFLHAAEFSSADGAVEIKKSGASLWTHARPKTAVGTGDVIRTGAGAKAEVLMEEGHRVSLREKTTARVESAAKGDSRFFLEVGKLKARVSKLRNGSKFEVHTPLAVASVRGTVFEVEVAEDQSSKLFVLEGRVGYKELSGLGREAMVPAGESLTYSPPAGPPAGAPGDDSKLKPKRDDDSKLKPKKDDEESKLKRKDEENAKRAPKKEKDEDSKLKPKRDEESRLKPKREDGGETPDPKTVFIDKDDLKRELLKDDFKKEVQRETEMSIEKEFVQADVAQDLKQEQAETGKVLIDHLGRRVRYEEYLTRPTENSFSQSFITRRDERTDTARYDVFAAKALPKDLRKVDLFRSQDKGALDNYATDAEWFVTNGDGYYREWKSDGKPVDFTDGGVNFQEVVFKDWYIEAKGDKEPVLLAHWQPDDNFIRGNYGATALRDRLDVYGIDNNNKATKFGDAGQDIPTGYVDFNNTKDDIVNGTAGIIGDYRPIDKTGWDTATRELYFTEGKVKDYYQKSEGYTRTAEGLFDGKSMAGNFGGKTDSDRRLELDKIRGDSTQQSIFYVYNGKYEVRLDGYYVTDEGKLYPYGKIGDSISGFTGINRELVYTTNMSKQDIDVMTGPSSLRPNDKEDVPLTVILP